MFELIFAFFLALILAGVFVAIGRRGPGLGSGFVFYFILFLLFGWAAALWIQPIGPAAYEIFWVGPLIATVLLWLIFLALIPVANGMCAADRF